MTSDRDMEQARQLLASVPLFNPDVIAGVAAALAAREREVWARVLALAAGIDRAKLDRMCAAIRDEDSCLDPNVSNYLLALLDILRAAEAGAQG